MKEILLFNLKLRNFKGIREFSLDCQGEDVSVFGDNAVGKTTLFDAFTWAMFDKDSANKKDFSIKTLDVIGKELSGLEHEVEVTLLIDGQRRTLRKRYTEKWTKKRGSATHEFSGHTTDYFVDDVPVKKGEYADTVDAVINENVFKLLTSPSYFNEQLHWQDRRKTLLEICGDVSEEEVIASNKALTKLPAILAGRSIEDHRKVIAAKRSEINKELEKIPVRIDEVRRSMPEVDGLDEDDLNQEIDLVKAQIEQKEAEMSRVQSGGEFAVKEKLLRELEGDLLEIKNRAQAGTMDKLSAKRKEVAEQQRLLQDCEFSLQHTKRRIAEQDELIADRRAKADRLRNKWTEINSEAFAGQAHSEDCPTCGQQLPADQITAAHEKSLAAFNRDKAERLEGISSIGKAAAAEAKRLEQEKITLTAELERLTVLQSEIRSDLDSALTQLQAVEAGMQDVTADPEYLSKGQEVEAVRKEILWLRSSVLSTVESLRMELSRLRTAVYALEQDKAKIKLVHSAEQRISDLAKQEKMLSAEFEQLENELFLTEEFIRTKVSMLEDRINTKFRLARFKLFDQQINGGLQEVCETLYRGVPYGSGLNNAARINVGLDIINTLSQHYGFSAPIFVDNAEAVTQLIETNAQVIRLVVSAGDKQLRVEPAEKQLTVNVEVVR